MPAALDSHCGLWLGASPRVVATDETGRGRTTDVLETGVCVCFFMAL